MDQVDLKQQIALYYSRLPAEAQEAFSSMQWLETLKRISSKYGLNGQEVETLGTETTLVLLGIISLTEYEEILRKDLSLPPTSIQKMIEEIDAQVINPILPQLLSAFEENTKFSTTENPDIDQKLDEKFKKLAPEVQQAVISSNYQAKLYSISRENNLTTAQLGTLEQVTTQVILGEIPPEKFEAVLKVSLDLSEDKIRILALEVSEQILKDLNTRVINRFAPTSNTIKKEEAQILKSAGIEIIDHNLTDRPELPSPMAQKLAAPVKTESKKTDYSLKPLNPPAPPTKPSMPKVDPYREPI